MPDFREAAGYVGPLDDIMTDDEIASLVRDAAAEVAMPMRDVPFTFKTLEALVSLRLDGAIMNAFMPFVGRGLDGVSVSICALADAVRDQNQDVIDIALKHLKVALSVIE